MEIAFVDILAPVQYFKTQGSVVFSIHWDVTVEVCVGGSYSM